MNSIRLLCGVGSGLNMYGAKLMKVPQVGSKSTQVFISRVYSQGQRETIWKTSRARRKTLTETALGPSKGTAISIGEGLTAGAAVCGLGALAYYGFGFGDKAGIVEQAVLWPQYVRDRVRNTYLYFGTSLGLTTLGAIACLRTPALFRLVSKNSIAALVGSIVVVMGTGIAAQSIEYAPGLNAKHIAWALHSLTIGSILSPLAFIGGPILIRAMWYTLGTVGGLTSIAVCAPSDKFLTYGGPLAMCLGFVFVSSIGSAFLPATTALGSGLAAVSLYGGLLVFSGLMLYDTQRIIRKAETHPLYAIQPFDPINASISIYMDTINIFIRIVAILSGANGRKR